MSYQDLKDELEIEIGIKLTSFTDDQVQRLYALFGLLKDVKEAVRAFSLGVRNGKDN